MKAPAASTTLTEFLQHSGRFIHQVDDGEIFLRRRDGDDLVLVSRPHWDALSDSLTAMVAAYQRLCLVDEQAARQVVSAAIPWISLLAPADQIACLDELSQATIGGLQFGRLSYLAALLAQWRATALASWDEQQKTRTTEMPRGRSSATAQAIGAENRDRAS